MFALLEKIVYWFMAFVFLAYYDQLWIIFAWTFYCFVAGLYGFLNDIYIAFKFPTPPQTRTKDLQDKVR